MTASASDPASDPASEIELAPAEVDVEKLADGGRILRSPRPLPAYEPHLGVLLRRGAERHPERLLLAERQGEDWRRVGWGEALAAAEAVGQALLERGLGPEKPVLVLSGNSIDHALLMLGAFLAGVPVAPVSPAYSLLSGDYAKVHHIVRLVEPGLVFVENPAAFAGVLQALDFSHCGLVTSGAAAGEALPPGLVSESFADLLAVRPGAALRRAEAGVGPDSVAKYLFTSGSTGIPKGVINTHRMLVANQQMIEECWPFVKKTPPVLVDWLPWNHTFGANHNFNLVLQQGGTLYIDAGKPKPGLFDETVRNLREISPTIYFNVPAGFSHLVAHLERDAALRENFFRRLQLVFYAAAALPQDVWEKLETLSERTLGRRVMLTSAWGSTETSPLATSAHFPSRRAGVIGLPPPGAEIKMVPAEDGKMELRVRGPMVFPGYLRQDALTHAAFDADGFYKIGDAGRFADPEDPARGLVFDGRVAEDFKLSTGTWVNAGQLRVEALAAVSPAFQDAVITGHGRDFVGLLAWLDVEACQRMTGLAAASAAELARHPLVRDHVSEGLTRFNAEAGGSSRRIERVLFLTTPPSIDDNEITDKGYINQSATLENRAAEVERLYAGAADILTLPLPRPSHGSCRRGAGSHVHGRRIARRQSRG